MDPLEQRLLAQILQQPEQKPLQLKEYQAIMEHLQRQILNPEIIANNFWFALFTMQGHEMTYPNFIQNLNASAISSTPTCNRQRIFSEFNSVINTNYLPAFTPSAMSFLNIPTAEEVQFDELANFLVVDELQKIADSAKQTWHNLMQHHEVQLPRLSTQHELHQQVPSVSPFMKRQVSESLQQQQAMESGRTTVIKRAKVIVIEQKDPESTPCCSSSPFLCHAYVKFYSPVLLRIICKKHGTMSGTV